MTGKQNKWKPAAIQTQADLKAVLRYDAGTGDFHWLMKANNRLEDRRAAGWLNAQGYIEIGYGGKCYKAHRLAWLYVYGVWPQYEIDHKDRVRNNNRIDNLRDAKPTQNMKNIGMLARNKSGYKGVSWKAKNKKWVAQAKHEGKVRHLGLFDTAEEASEAYQEFARQHHGEFYLLGE